MAIFPYIMGIFYLLFFHNNHYIYNYDHINKYFLVHYLNIYNNILATQAQLIRLQAAVINLINSRMGLLACQRILMGDLNAIMRIPSFGVTVNGLTVYGGG